MSFLRTISNWSFTFKGNDRADKHTHNTPSASGPFDSLPLLTSFALLVFSPCEQAAKASLSCMDRNGYNRDKCMDFFQAYRDCKKAWVRYLASGTCCESSILIFFQLEQRREDRRAGLPTPTWTLIVWRPVLCISRAVLLFYQHDLSNTTTVESVGDLYFRLIYCILGNNAHGRQSPLRHLLVALRATTFNHFHFPLENWALDNFFQGQVSSDTKHQRHHHSRGTQQVRLGYTECKGRHYAK